MSAPRRPAVPATDDLRSESSNAALTASELDALVATGIPKGMASVVARYRAAAEREQHGVMIELQKRISAVASRAAFQFEIAARLERDFGLARAAPLYRDVADSIGNEIGALACLRTGCALFDGVGCATDRAEAARYLMGAARAGALAAPILPSLRPAA